MRDDEMTQAADEVRKLFSPSSPNPYIPLTAKLFFLTQELKREWPGIAGGKAGAASEPYRIRDHELSVRAGSSAAASHLYIHHDEILQKANKLVGDRYPLKRILFKTGSIAGKESGHAEAAGPEPRWERCARCGAPFTKLGDEALCKACWQEDRQAMKKEARKLLHDKPWLRYDEASAYTRCDRYTFEAVRSELMSAACEKIRYGRASQEEALEGISFLARKRPDELTDAAKENALKHLTRNRPKYQGQG